MARFGNINQQTQQIHHKYQKYLNLNPTSSVVKPSPKKRHHTFQQNGNKVQEKGCHICNETATKSMWLGCGHKNKLTGRDDCSYWVHQWCIGLYYKRVANLATPRFHSTAHNTERKSKGR